MPQQGVRSLVVAMLCWSALPSAFGAGVRVTAISGQEFGVGEISFPIGAADQAVWHQAAIRLDEKSGRVLFPILQHAGPLQRLAGQLDGGLTKPPTRSSIFFLFTGTQPLELQLRTSRVIDVTAVPEVRPAKRDRLARRWWTQMWGPLGDRIRENGRPRPVETYLSGLGLWRFGINRHPAIPRINSGDVFNLLFDATRLRTLLYRDVAFATTPRHAATEPLPPPIHWSAPTIIDPLENVETEPIADRVVDNCFYVRFGKYSNMLWLTRLIEQQSEELQRLVTLRGFAGNSVKNLETQLAIEELPMADLIGDKLISDVALVGRDTFVGDGAAMGVVIRSTNDLVRTGLQGIREQAVKRLAKYGARGQDLQIDGQDVSLISTPNNRLRSFLHHQDEWYFITNSRTMMEEYLALGTRTTPLSENLEFRHLRQKLPCQRDDTVFVFVPTNFIRSLTSPQTITELYRRTLSHCELSMVEVAVRADQAVRRARLAAGQSVVADEGQETVARLVASGMLPPQFGVRADSSHVRWIENEAVDTTRGVVGHFLPAIDIPVDAVTTDEAAFYQLLSQRYSGIHSEVDPLAISIGRTTREGGAGDHLAIDLIQSPARALTRNFLVELLGPPVKQRLMPTDDAIINLQMSLGGRLLGRPEGWFAALDVLEGEPVQPPPTTKFADLIALAQRTPSVLRTVPGNHVFNTMFWRPTQQPDIYTGVFKLWGRQCEDHAVIAFDQSKLQQPEGPVFDAVDRPQQVWLKIGELKNSSLADAVTAIAEARAMRGSLRNVQMFHRWTSILGQPTSEAADLVESFVHQNPVCPLDGAYQLAATAEREPLWRSTAWSTDRQTVQGAPIATSDEYQPALLRWWRGIEASASIRPDEFRLVADVEVQFSGEERKPAMPSLKSLFGGAGRGKTKGKKATKPTAEPARSP